MATARPDRSSDRAWMLMARIVVRRAIIEAVRGDQTFARCGQWRAAKDHRRQHVVANLV